VNFDGETTSVFKSEFNRFCKDLQSSFNPNMSYNETPDGSWSHETENSYRAASKQSQDIYPKTAITPGGYVPRMPGENS
jgi:hypothetical protein